jgi:hypothetical protein
MGMNKNYLKVPLKSISFPQERGILLISTGVARAIDGLVEGSRWREGRNWREWCNCVVFIQIDAPSVCWLNFEKENR